jgi:hypothetical protein
LNRKERRRQQHQKKVYEAIRIPDVPGRPELDLSGEVLESLKDIPKVEHYTSKKYRGYQKINKRACPVIRGQCVSATFKDYNPNPNDHISDFSVSIDDPKFCFVFLESFNAYLSH